MPVKQSPTLPRPGLLRRQIGIALLVKLILLIGLWFMAKRLLYIRIKNIIRAPGLQGDPDNLRDKSSLLSVG